VNLLLADDRFHAFSGQHYLMIAITVLGRSSQVGGAETIAAPVVSSWYAACSRP
jgi:hypothetical protein